LILDVLKSQLGIQFAIVKTQSEILTQQLTHQQIKARFIRVALDKMPASLKKWNGSPRKNQGLSLP